MFVCFYLYLWKPDSWGSGNQCQSSSLICCYWHGICFKSLKLVIYCIFSEFAILSIYLHFKVPYIIGTLTIVLQKLYSWCFSWLYSYSYWHLEHVCTYTIIFYIRSSIHIKYGFKHTTNNRTKFIPFFWKYIQLCQLNDN